jgi:hypothetical protein
VTLGVCIEEGEIPFSCFEKGNGRKCVADVSFDLIVRMSLTRGAACSNGMCLDEILCTEGCSSTALAFWRLIIY